MKTGIIGSGEMGSLLAMKLSRAGHDIAIANSRGPESLSHLEAPGIAAVTVEEAIMGKEVVIIAIAVKNIPNLPRDIFRRVPHHTAIIDAGNYYPSLRDGAIISLDHEGIDSMWVQEQLGVTITKGFNAILATSLRDKAMPKGAGGRIAIPVAGDDVGAKEIMSRLADDIGFDVVDTGSLSQSWKQQPGSPIYCRDITAEEMRRRLGIMTEHDIGLNDIAARRKADEMLMASDYSAYLRSLNG